MPEISVKNTGQVIEVPEGSYLLTELLKNSVFIDNPCNGTGTCGKCKVRVIGNDRNIGQSEKKHLSDSEMENDVRLSCFVRVDSDLEIELIHKEKKGKVLSDGYVPEFEKDLFNDGYGLAVDIGTTTVVAEAIDLKSGKAIGRSSMVNPQKQFGLDVLTRITYEYENEDGIKSLQKCIVSGLNSLIDEIVEETCIDRKLIREMVVGANTTMLHLLLGVDARSLGKYPYNPAFKESRTVMVKDLGLELSDEATVYTLPNVSAFIGSDIVSGAYVCNMHNEKDNVLFIDIGTNGEIVLKSNGKLVCCSCAAGPALEGMNISCGMRAASGAIEDLKIDKDSIKLKTIDNEEPSGLCGSGILAAVRELLFSGIVLKNGAFVKKEKLPEDDWRQKYIGLTGNKRELILDDKRNIRVTQGDVRQVQLAKGAILSGFMALLNHHGIKMEDLDKVLIAGQFGMHLPVDSLTGVGILPKEVRDRIVYVGNTSKTGAYMALMSRKVREEMDLLAKDMEYLELAVTDNYENIFRESMLF